MIWKVEFTERAVAQLKAIDPENRNRIGKAVKEKLFTDARRHLVPLHGALKTYYKFRVGDYRLFCTVDDAVVTVTVVKVLHRSVAYR